MSLFSHPAIPAYQSRLAQLKAQGHFTEAQTRRAFEDLLVKISEARNLTFVAEFPVGPKRNRKTRCAIL